MKQKRNLKPHEYIQIFERGITVLERILPVAPLDNLPLLDEHTLAQCRALIDLLAELMKEARAKLKEEGWTK